MPRVSECCGIQSLITHNTKQEQKKKQKENRGCAFCVCALHTKAATENESAEMEGNIVISYSFVGGA